jgi:hypothetical protein
LRKDLPAGAAEPEVTAPPLSQMTEGAAIYKAPASSATKPMALARRGSIRRCRATPICNPPIRPARFA